MAAGDILRRGENKVFQTQLYRIDGTTPLLLSELSAISVQVKQYGRVLATYTLTPTPDPVDPEILEGDSTSQLKVIITKELSAMLKEGAVYLRPILEEVNAEFTPVGEDFNDQDEILMYTVI